MGFFDNMDVRPIMATTWKHSDIVGDIADDVEQITLGLLLLGNGTATLDEYRERLNWSMSRSTLVNALPALGLTR